MIKVSYVDSTDIDVDSLMESTKVTVLGEFLSIRKRKTCFMPSRVIQNV